ncbi:unnamed protein product [Ectocarpus sp. CCAP 1310/34]|nr:unnamed protein product [Ectocarpus sp. CCAP 1310/34]
MQSTSSIPASPGADRGPKRDDESGGEWPVREAIGSMMWVSTFSRPDISFAVRAVARHAHAPAERHWKAIVKILAYLKETRDLGITYERGSGLGLAVYVDASYADAEDGVPCQGWQQRLEGPSSATYLCRLRRQMLSFIAPETSGSSIQVLEDNQGAMALVQNPLSSARSKHIDVRYHFIRGLFRSGDISIKFVSTSEQHAMSRSGDISIKLVSTSEQHANLLTKALSKSSLQYHRRKLMNLPE